MVLYQNSGVDTLLENVWHVCPRTPFKDLVQGTTVRRPGDRTETTTTTLHQL